jgi:anaerobic magnesium-protoporphyrin IX monomethyl ester cyclase
MTKTKLLLISLRDPFLDDDRVMPPIGVMSLHSFIVEHDIECVIENDFQVDDLEKYQTFTHFGISCMTPQKAQLYDFVSAIKSRFPDKKVIVGGPHPTIYLEECKKYPFDHIVLGDGELALLSILKDDNPKQVISMPYDEKEMNEFPIPYRHPDFLKQYSFDIQSINSTTILTSKGCPMSCAFCEDANTRVRYYSPEYVGKQIVEAKAAGFKGLMFFDDLFAISVKRVQALTEEIIKHNLPYRCFGHARIMNERIAELLASSGCIEMGFGAESGSQKILDIVNKKTTVKQNYEFVKICNDQKIKVKAFIILGLPGEDQSTVDETDKFLDFLMDQSFINRFGREVTNDFDITIYFPYKGTKIRDSIDNGESTYDLSLIENPSNMSGFYKGKGGSSEIVIRTAAFTSDQLHDKKQGLWDKHKSKVVL